MSKLETELLSWETDPGEFRGDIGVLTRLDGAHWRGLGAQFCERDDGQGETPGLAAGRVHTSLGEISFGILDYGEDDETYLLAPAGGDERRRLTAEIIGGLEAAGALTVDDLEDEESSYRDVERLVERVTTLEQFVGESLTSAAHSAVPIATEVTVQTEPEARPLEIGHKEHWGQGGHIGTLSGLQDGKDWALIHPEDGSGVVKVELVEVDSPLGKLREGMKVKFRYGLVETDEEPGELRKQWIRVKRSKGGFRTKKSRQRKQRLR